MRPELRFHGPYDFVPNGHEQPWFRADDPLPIVADLLDRHSGVVPGLNPAVLTRTTHVHEGKYVPQDRPNGQRRRRMLDVFCWCGRKLVKMTPSDVLAGRTMACGHVDCVAIATGTPPPRPAVASPVVRTAHRSVRTQSTPTAAGGMDPRAAAWPESKFWERVEKTDGCWNWIGYVNPSGYGQFSSPINGTQRCMGAHRWSYELNVGPVPEGLELDHLCRNRQCVNPKHLEAVTHAENVRRGTSGAVTTAAAAKRKTCRKGHPLVAENLYVITSGDGYTRRYCRTCQGLRVAAFRARQATADHYWSDFEGVA